MQTGTAVMPQTKYSQADVEAWSTWEVQDWLTAVSVIYNITLQYVCTLYVAELNIV